MKELKEYCKTGFDCEEWVNTQREQIRDDPFVTEEQKNCRQVRCIGLLEGCIQERGCDERVECLQDSGYYSCLGECAGLSGF